MNQRDRNKPDKNQLDGSRPDGAEQGQMSPEKIEPGRHHVSKVYVPITVVKRLWAVAVGIVAIIAGIVDDLLKNADNVVELAGRIKMLPVLGVVCAIVILGLITLIVILSYYRLTWEITDEELHVYKGLIVKKKSHIPFRRIHSVDINAGILDRIFGVVTVKLDTAAGSAKAEDAKIPCLRLSTAEMLRREIFYRKAETESGMAAANTDSGHNVARSGGGNIFTDLNIENDKIRGIYAGASQDMTPKAEYRLSNRELIIHCIANGKSFAIIFVVLAFLWQVFDVVSQVDESVEVYAEDMMTGLASMGPAIIVVLVLVAFLASLIVSFVTRALTYGNFVVKRYATRVEVSTGLLQKKSTGVAVERIQTLKVERGLLQRILGYASISIETASGFGKASGSGEQDDLSGIIIHPFIRADKIEDFMDMMLSEFNDRPKKPQGLTPLAMRRSMVRYGLFTLIFVLLPANLLWYMLKDFIGSEGVATSVISTVDYSVLSVSVVLLLLMPVVGWAAWKGRGYVHNDRYILLQAGIIGRKRTLVPRTKIQYAQVGQNPFQKRVALATIKANTAALGSSFQTLKDVEVSWGDEYLEWIAR